MLFIKALRLYLHTKKDRLKHYLQITFLILIHLRPSLAQEHRNLGESIEKMMPSHSWHSYRFSIPETSKLKIKFYSSMALLDLYLWNNDKRITLNCTNDEIKNFKCVFPAEKGQIKVRIEEEFGTFGTYQLILSH